jgi:hypothetical protein
VIPEVIGGALLGFLGALAAVFGLALIGILVMSGGRGLGGRGNAGPPPPPPEDRG